MGHFDAAAQATPATAMWCSIHATEVGLEAAKALICKEYGYKNRMVNMTRVSSPMVRL